MREQRLMNNGWKFVYGKRDCDQLSDQDQWSDIGLPHSFGIPYFMENEFYVGYGCYLKTIVLGKEDLKKRILLEFLGSFQVTEIFLNGKFLSIHQGGYTSFIVNLTGLLLHGENKLFVRVNNLWDATIAPRAGEHQFNGGIYRDVYLHLTEHNCVDWMGTFIKTEKLEHNTAAVSVETDVLLEKLSDSAVLESRIMYEGKIILTKQSPLLSKNCQKIFQSFTLSDPKLWTPESPSRYHLQQLVSVCGAVVDIYETDFGVRTLYFDKDHGFFLNGEHYDVLGANVHQDHAGWADAVTRSSITRDIQMIKDCGMNFIRGSHYPHHPFFAEECDRIGLLFWSELCFWGTGGTKQEGYWTSSAYPVHEKDKKPFEENCIKTLEEMILVNRNHPSIITWSMCNEPFFSEPEVIEEAKALVSLLVERSHALDPSRPAAVGGAQRGGFDVLGDIAGYNGDGASLYIDPGFPNFVSEYGSVCAYRPGIMDPNYTDNVDTAFDWRSGKAIWCGFHHGSILGNMGSMGMIDYYRLPLNTWHWYRKQLLNIDPPEPRRQGVAYCLDLTSDVNIMTADGQQDAWLYVQVLDKNQIPLSNELEVTLTVVEGDGIFPTGKSITFSPADHSFLDGQAAIEFRSYYGGINMIEATADGIKSDRVIIQAIGASRINTLVPMTPPPYVCSQPNAGKGERYNLASNKPVFTNSNLDGCSPVNVTLENDAFWAPKMEPNAWIQLDLEGVRSVVGIDVEFANLMWSKPYMICLSKDGKNEIQMEITPQNGYSSIHGQWNFRFIKIVWKNGMKGIRCIRVWIV